MSSGNLDLDLNQRHSLDVAAGRSSRLATVVGIVVISGLSSTAGLLVIVALSLALLRHVTSVKPLPACRRRRLRLPPGGSATFGYDVAGHTASLPVLRVPVAVQCTAQRRGDVGIGIGPDNYNCMTLPESRRQRCQDTVAEDGDSLQSSWTRPHPWIRSQHSGCNRQHCLERGAREEHCDGRPEEVMGRFGNFGLDSIDRSSSTTDSVCCYTTVEDSCEIDNGCQLQLRV